MAGRLVFPGGRLDPSDLALAPAFDLGEPALSRLCRAVTGRFTARRATAIALAAIRETYEETGIMIGRADGRFDCSMPVWQDFAQAGVTPDPRALVPFARAITPPRQVRRFDTRFFTVEAGAIARQVPFDQRPTDEFDLVAWMSLDEFEAEDLHHITRRIGTDLRERLSAEGPFDGPGTMPLYRHLRGVFRRDLI